MREQGKPRFLLRSTLLYAVLLALLSSLVDLFDLDAAASFSKHFLSWRILFYVGTGILISLLNWWLMERTYRKLKSNG